MATFPPFDPFTQTLTLLYGDSTPFNISVPEIDEFVLYSVQICINYAAQLGASLILLIVLLLLTKADRRSSPIFIINLICLALNVIRNVLFCLYFTGPFSETYAYFGQDYSKVQKSDYAESVTAAVLSLLVLIGVELSLILQVRVVFATSRKVYKLAVSIASIIIALTAIGLHSAFTIKESVSVVSLTFQTSLNRLESASNIITTISICWFCLVFVTKLGIALNERRKLGLDRFGPMQVIFIMGCQTLMIPAIFSILQYIAHVPELSSNVLTLVSIFLPLSSLWASATTPGNSSSPHSTSRRNKIFWSFYSGSTGPLINDTVLSSPRTPSTTAQRTSQSTIPSPNNTNGSSQAGLYRDLEAQDLVLEEKV